MMIDTGKQVIDTWNGIHCILACTVRMMMTIAIVVVIIVIIVAVVHYVKVNVVNGRSVMMLMLMLVMMMCGVSSRGSIRCIGGMRSEDGGGTIIGGM